MFSFRNCCFIVIFKRSLLRGFRPDGRSFMLTHIATSQKGIKKRAMYVLRYMLCAFIFTI